MKKNKTFPRMMAWEAKRALSAIEKHVRKPDWPDAASEELAILISSEQNPIVRKFMESIVATARELRMEERRAVARRKKILRLVTAVLFMVMVGACAATTSRLRDISVGMEKAQVYEKMGTPEIDNADGTREVFTYTLRTSATESWTAEPYWIVFENGKVVRYGRAADLDPTPRRQLSDAERAVILQHALTPARR